MKEHSVRTWSGPAITAKVLIPLALTFIAGLVAVPVRDIFTAAWFFLVVLPIEGAAIWLFLNIGEIRPASDGVLYRKWVRWYHIPSQEICDVVRVLPCFAALVLKEHVKLVFFPDPEARRLVRSFHAAVHGNHTHQPADAAAPVSQNPSSVVGAVFSFLTGAALGVAIWATARPAANYDTRSRTAVFFVSRYLPPFVCVSLLYLMALVLAGRLKTRELYISLALIGLGVVYLLTDVFHVL
jgi:hypothetical protein